MASGAMASVVVFVALLLIAALLEAAARRERGPATMAEALGAAMRTTPGRVAVLTAWLWLGLHFLAR